MMRLCLAVFLLVGCFARAAAEDGADAAAEQYLDLSKLEFYGRDRVKDPIDGTALSMEGKVLLAPVPFPTVKGRTSDLVACRLEMPAKARSVLLSYRVRMAQGISHRVVIELSNGLLLYFLDLQADRPRAGDDSFVTPDEWHSISVRLSPDGGVVLLDGKVMGHPSGLKKLRPFELQFQCDGDPGAIALADVQITE
jgi:hypothetical protein